MTRITLFWRNCFALFLCSFWLSTFQLVSAEPRIALVVGNGQYSSVSPLDNPVPDALLMAQELEAAGFTVSVVTDANQTVLNRAIAQFGRDLRSAGNETTGLFYYAGHGVQSFGTNYLVPIDAALTDAADLSLVGVQAEAVLRQMASAKNKTNIMILDACRDNPFEAIADLGDNGLAEMKAPTGTFLAYSTAPGAVALDGLEGNSPFTKSLAKQMSTEGLPIEQVFKQVRVDVLEQTSGQQTPWDTSSLTVPFSFIQGEVMSPEDVAAMQLWDSVRDTNDPVQIMLFLRGYPKSKFSDEARTVLNDLLKAELGPEPEKEVAAAPEPETEPVTSTAPVVEEKELIDIARTSGKAVDYQAYLSVFPSGVYAELAKFELDIIAKKAAKAEAQTEVAAAPARAAPAPAPAPKDAARVEPSGPTTFESPVLGGAEQITGLNFEQIIQISPLFAPIEGLPESVWKEKSCSNCHAWTRTALCDQGKTYLKANAERSLNKQHPFGGSFKQHLRHWADTGCQ